MLFRYNSVKLSLSMCVYLFMKLFYKFYRIYFLIISSIQEMDSIRFLCITLCLFGLFEKPNLVQGGKLNLMSNLMKQADTLKHGLDLANQVGDIGKFLFGHLS